MRVRFLATWALWMMAAGTCAGAGAATRPAGAVDFLDYFLQSDDVEERWTIGGTDVRPASRDPEGTAAARARTVILSKFSNPNCYEVFKVTDWQIQIRYEVMRWGGAKGTENWIRRFSEIDAGDQAAAGAVWMNRWVVPGGPGVLSRFRQDKWGFDVAGRQYVIDRAGSAERMETYASCVWAEVTWPMGDETGFGIDRVLRQVSEWQGEGMMVEMYDYAKGKGLVGWRWLERVSTLKPLKDDRTGKVFHCEEGLAYVEKDGGARPRAWQCDARGAKGRELEMVQFQSYWKPQLGNQWYVVYRDLSREQKLVKKMERVEHDFALPEWGTKKTIEDLTGLFTR